MRAQLLESRRFTVDLVVCSGCCGCGECRKNFCYAWCTDRQTDRQTHTERGKGEGEEWMGVQGYTRDQSATWPKVYLRQGFDAARHSPAGSDRLARGRLLVSRGDAPEVGCALRLLKKKKLGREIPGTQFSSNFILAKFVRYIV